MIKLFCRRSAMKLIGNIIWLMFGGFLMATEYLILGVVFCVTIIGLPVGFQLFKLGELSLTPFGHKVKYNFAAHPLLNIIWALFVGFGLMLECLMLAIMLCVTIIGIPFAKQMLKLAGLSLIPFGATIDKC